jgi:hypothetical protein
MLISRLLVIHYNTQSAIFRRRGMCSSEHGCCAIGSFSILTIPFFEDCAKLKIKMTAYTRIVSKECSVKKIFRT